MKQKKVAGKFGIAEWYGCDVSKISTSDRTAFSKIALASSEGKECIVPVCPFSVVNREAKCNKIGGVCSIRKYNLTENGAVIPSDDPVATICPIRLLGAHDNQRTLFSWISEKILDCKEPIKVKETPFLKTINQNATSEGDGQEAGRIDWILIDPATIHEKDISWCAIETQALYFSGDAMKIEFEAYLTDSKGVVFPKGKRRPDYRSSGPKRLSPQLDVKVPVLRNWGKKVIVVVDQYFYENMSDLGEVKGSGGHKNDKRDNAEIIWFIVSYDSTLKLNGYKVVYSTLEDSQKALNASEPISKSQFNDNLRKVVLDDAKSNKVFRS